jgi:hypothetical protein
MSHPPGLSASEHLRRTGVFKVDLTGETSSTVDPLRAVQTHESVLRPLLLASTAAWVYRLTPDSIACSSAIDILEKQRGRYRIKTEIESIRGYEQFWNAPSDQRGTVVILTPADESLVLDLLPQCNWPRVISNYTVGHPPSSIRFARSATESGEQYAFLLSRGSDWLSIMATPQAAEELYCHALRLCQERAPVVA